MVGRQHNIKIYQWNLEIEEKMVVELVGWMVLLAPVGFTIWLISRGKNNG